MPLSLKRGMVILVIQRKTPQSQRKRLVRKKTPLQKICKKRSQTYTPVRYAAVQDIFYVKSAREFPRSREAIQPKNCRGPPHARAHTRTPACETLGMKTRKNAKKK